MTINQSFQNWTLITDEPGEELVFEHEDPETGQKDRFVLTEEAGLGSEMEPVPVNGEEAVSTSDDLVSLLNNASPNDRFVLMPGTHEIDGRFDPPDGVKVRGVGQPLTTIKRTTADAIFFFDAVDDWELRNLTLDGNQSSVTSTDIPNLLVTGSSSGWTVENVTSQNLHEPAQSGGSNHGFSVQTNSNGAPSDGEFIDCRAVDYGDDGFSVLADAANNRIPQNIEIINPYIDGTATSESNTHSGMELEGGVQNITVSGGRILGTYGAAINIGADDGTHDANQHVDIQGVTIDQRNASAGGASTAFLISHGNDPDTRANISISNINARGVKNDGVDISDVAGVDVSDSLIQTDGTSALLIDTGSDEISLDGVTGVGGSAEVFHVAGGSGVELSDCHAVEAATGAEGFKIDSGVTDVELSDCKSTKNDNHGYQIGASNVVLTGCVSRDDGGDGFRLNGTGAEADACKVYSDGSGVGFNVQASDCKLISPFSDGNFDAIRVSAVTDTRISDYRVINEGQDKIDDSGTRTRINGVGTESAAAETPTAASWDTGDVVDFTDSGDGSGNGVYKLLPDETWSQIGT